MIKKLIALVTCSVMLFTSAVFAENTEVQENNNPDIQIVINGEKITPKDVNGKIVNPFLLEGTTYLPVRAVSEALGQKVEWDGENRVVYIGEKGASAFDGSEIIKIVINGALTEPKDVNGKVVNPFLIDGTTYVPIRAITEALGKKIDWDGETKTIYITGDIYEVDLESLKAFADKTLIKVDTQVVSAGIFNMLLYNFTTDEFMKDTCDNYNPDGTLQTLTIDSVPAAQMLTSEIENTLSAVYAMCAHAEKINMTLNAEFKEISGELLGYIEQELTRQYGADKAIEAGIISKEDFQDFVNKFLVYILTSQSIEEDAAKKDYDVSEYENKFRSAYITAKHILVEDESLAKELIARIEKGEDFDTLMKEHNIDPGATAEGYTFTKGEMVEPFEKAAFELKENGLTNTPVKTDYGYHIVMRLPLNEKEVDSAMAYFKNLLAQNAAQEEINKIINNAKVEHTTDYQNYIKTIK